MKLAINALSLDPRMGGGWTFGTQLARALADNSAEHQVMLVGGSHNLESLSDLGCSVTSLGDGLANPARRIWTEQTRLPHLLLKHGIDAFISLDGTLPAKLKCPSISILQNLIYFHLASTRIPEQPVPGWLPWAQAQYFRLGWRHASSAARLCVSVSEATKKEFIRHFPRMQSRSVTIFEGVDPLFAPVSETDCDAPCILAVGRLYPHKRFERLIDLIADPNTPRAIRLKIIGDDWKGQKQRLICYARQRGVGRRLQILDAIERSELAMHYSRALCLGMLSDVESFGLPVVEAMACGTAAIVKGGGALEEVGGDAVHVASGGSLQSSVAFLKSLFQDERLRSRYRERAIHRAKDFAWDAIAQQYWAQIAMVVAADSGDRRERPAMAKNRERLESIYRRLPVALQTVAINVEGRRNQGLRMGDEFKAELKLLEESETYSAAELENLQNERLRALIKSAYANVPYYRAQWQRLSLTPDDIRSAADLKKLPILEKRDVAKAGELMINQALAQKDRIAGCTSGSTGASLQLVYDRKALAAEFATVWRLRRRYGCDTDQWHATFAGGRLVVPISQTRPPYHRHNTYQKQTLFSVYHLKSDTVGDYVHGLCERKYRFYSGYPSGLEALITAAQMAGIKLPEPERAIFTSSESLLDWQKQHLETTLGVPVYDRYGCAEFCVSFTVCPEGRYHLDEEFGIVELDAIEEDHDTITGELLCTGLTNTAMPFIRYRVGDVVTMSKTPCSCGRASRSAIAIDGRMEDYVMTSTGVRLGRLDHLFKDLPSIRESQILQHEAGRIRIRIVRGAEYARSDEEKLLRECEMRMGSEMNVDLEYVDGIARNRAGKFRAVINTLADARRYDR